MRVLLPLRRKRRTLATASPLAASRPSRRRSARVALLVASLVSLGAMGGLTAAVETVKPEWRDPEFGHRLARVQQTGTPGRPLVVVLGTSRTQNAIHPAAMGFADEPGSPRVFNFGQSASPPLKVLLTLLRLLDAGVRPSAVIVEVLPVWMATNGSAEELFAEKAALLSAADLRHLAPYCNDPDVLRSRWRAARVAPWYAQRFVLMSHWLPRWVPWSARVDFQWDTMDPDGYLPYPHAGPTAELRATATEHARQEYVTAFAGFRPGDASVWTFRDLVARCRAEGIPVAFFVPPVSPGFRKWFKPRVWDAGDAAIANLAAELGVPLFPPTAFTESEFVDGHHMLPATAAKYSRWLADTHLKAWLAGQGGVP